MLPPLIVGLALKRLVSLAMVVLATIFGASPRERTKKPSPRVEAKILSSAISGEEYSPKIDPQPLVAI